MSSELFTHASAPDSWDTLSSLLPFPASMSFRPVMVVAKKSTQERAFSTTAERMSPSTQFQTRTQHQQQCDQEPSLLGSSMQPIGLAAFPSMEDDWEDEDAPHVILGHHLRVPFRASSPPLTSASTGEPIPEVMEPNEIPTFVLIHGQTSSLEMTSRKMSPYRKHSFSHEDVSTSKFGLSSNNEVSRSMASYTADTPQHIYEEIDMRRYTTITTAPEHIYPPTSQSEVRTQQ